MERVMALRGLIYSKYKSEAEFAKSIGWSRQKLNRITTGRKEPDLQETSEIAAGLGRPLEEIAHIFLVESSPNGQQ